MTTENSKNGAEQVFTIGFNLWGVKLHYKRII